MSDRSMLVVRAEESAIASAQTFQIALRESADALIPVQKTRGQRAVTKTNRLSRPLYEGGVASYLQVLDSDRNLFDAEISLAQVQRDELRSVVRLFRALGGGWRR